MRETLYRGKTSYNGKWIKGFAIFADGKAFILFDAKVVFDESYPENKLNFMLSEVIPETVGQYTGLTDKNGKKIFVGDIIKWGLKPCVVKWDEYNASFCLYIYGIVKISGFNRDTMKLKEVIGNIFDNPELLKGAEQ